MIGPQIVLRPVFGQCECSGSSGNYGSAHPGPMSWGCHREAGGVAPRPGLGTGAAARVGAEGVAWWKAVGLSRVAGAGAGAAGFRLGAPGS